MNAPKDQGVSAGGSLFLARVALALMQCKQIFAALSLCPKGGRKVQAPVSAHQPGFYTETRKKNQTGDQRVFFAPFSVSVPLTWVGVFSGGEDCGDPQKEGSRDKRGSCNLGKVQKPGKLYFQQKIILKKQ